MKSSPHPLARKRVAHSLKLVCFVIFCAFACAILIARFKSQSASAQRRRAPVVSARLAPANLPPEIAPIRFTRVGVGQRITFGISLIDPESDDLRVELVQKPASAKYN